MTEIIVFGPGLGESSLVRIEGDKWVVIDSACNPETGEPLALRYLRERGLDAATCIKMVIVTHWHTDHIRGVSEITRAATEATVVLPLTFVKEKFQKFLYTYENGIDYTSLQCHEILKLFGIFKAEKSLNKSRFKFAAADKTIISDNFKNEIEAGLLSIVTLSPSEPDTLAALAQFNDLTPYQNDCDCRFLPSLDPNSSSVVTWIRINGFSLLFGADMENAKEESRGWKAIVGNSWNYKPKAGFFKIPHHGSANAHNDDVWVNLLERPCAVVTPYMRLTTPIPTQTDLNRLKSKAKELYLTSNPVRRHRKFEDKTVQKAIQEATKQHFRETFADGYVRFKKPEESASWAVELYGSALKVN